MRYLLLIVVLFAASLQAEEEVKLPYAIRSAEERMVKDVDRALKDYNEAVERASGRYIKVLEKELKDAMKDGDLKLANAINDKLKSIKDLKAAAAAMKTVTFNKEAAENAEPKQPEGIEWAYGTYEWDGWKLTIASQNRIMTNWKARGEKNGKWSILSSEKDKAVLSVVFASGKEQTWTIKGEVLSPYDGRYFKKEK